MKNINRYVCLLLLFILLNSGMAAAQQKDTIVSLPVSGVCSLCKERIETAAKGKGVHYTNWDATIKFLSLHYNPAVTSIEKITSRILNAGHDVNGQKADDLSYKHLPQCCLYREPSAVTQEIPAITTDSMQQNPGESFIRGVVMEESVKGSFTPMAGASVTKLNSHKGVITDSAGVFRIEFKAGDQLVISYTGYKSDTIEAINKNVLMIVLAKGKELREVIVKAKDRSLYMSTISPIRTQVMTEKELFKAACCNLSESFETNSSTDVSYTDAVTGSKQIQLLGLSGIYTQLTIENLPGPRGLATPLGLNFIAGPWIESIQLTKGIGSVVNGYESIAGQINVELKKPDKSEPVYLNLYTNSMGKKDLNLNLATKIGEKWSTMLLLHNDFLTNNHLDGNKDGFRDLPTGSLWSAVHRWKYENGKGSILQFGFKLLHDDKTGGQTDFNPVNDKLTTTHYGLGIKTNRYEAFLKSGYVFPGKKYKSYGIQLSTFQHQQDSYFGLLSYAARQKNLYFNFIYQSIIGNTNHKFRTGTSFVSDKYNEDVNSTIYKRMEQTGGVFFEYTYDYKNKLNFIAGLRTDYNSLYGWFLTPRLHLRYEPVKGTIFRLSAGRGQRTANIFAENMSLFVSSRKIIITPSEGGKAYGLLPEISWNKGVSIDQSFRLFNRNATAGIDFFRNDFIQQVVIDVMNVRTAEFYNLKGHSYSNSLQAELTFIPLPNLEVRVAHRFLDVKTKYKNGMQPKPLTSRNRAFINLAYEVNGWKMDYTITYNSSKQVPSTEENPAGYQFPEKTPSYVLMNAQISKTIGAKKQLELYLGGENLGNFFQKKTIIAADDPFGEYFDASLVWGPVTGRQFYFGIRWKVKQKK